MRLDLAKSTSQGFTVEFQTLSWGSLEKKAFYLDLSIFHGAVQEKRLL